MEKKRSPTLAFIPQHEEVHVPFQVETPRVLPGPVSCKFGSCSLFDVRVETVDALPVEFPTASFLDETLAGMLGAPGNGPASKNWLRLQAVVIQDSAAQCCTALTWVVLGHLFQVVEPHCMSTLKQTMAQNWFQLSLQIDSLSEGNRRFKDNLMEAVPAVFVQAIYRMMIECFPPEQRALALSSQDIVVKVTKIVQHEVAGMQWRPETWQKLRERLFCPQVLESPQLNQRESMEVCRKKAKRERGNVCEDEKPPLHFGASHGPMSDAQLESVMTLRQKAADESPTKRSSLAHQQALKGWTSDHLREHLSDRAVQRLDALKRRAQEEMSVDRYEELAVRAEELMANQMDQLYADGGWEPGKTPPELVCNLGDLGDDPFSLKEASLHPDLSFDSENKDLSIKRTQSVRSLRDSTVAVRRERERREAELAERRRRDELLEKYLAAQLPETFSQHTFDTSLVSPALDRLAPSDSARRLLPPLKTLKQKVKMKTPKALEVTSTDKGAACAQTQPRADRSGPNQGRQGSKSSVGSLNMGQREGVRSNQLIRSQSGSKVMLSMEPTNLKEEVVVSRLQQHMEAFREASFDNVKKDTDILTGQRRQRLDAAALDRDERAFIEKMEAMVGSKSTPAIRHLRPVLKKTGSMPKLLGQRQPRNTKDQYHKPKLAGQPTAVLEQVSRAMAQQARAETMQVEVQKVTWNQLTAVNLLGP